MFLILVQETHGNPNNPQSKMQCIAMLAFELHACQWDGLGPGVALHQAIVKMIDISRASKQEKDDALKESKATSYRCCGHLSMVRCCGTGSFRHLAQVLASLKHPYIVRYRESFHEAFRVQQNPSEPKWDAQIK